jgi:hypothetical protein
MDLTSNAAFTSINNQTLAKIESEKKYTCQTYY